VLKNIDPEVVGSNPALGIKNQLSLRALGCDSSTAQQGLRYKEEDILSQLVIGFG
jgi:hypothetical protein